MINTLSPWTADKQHPLYLSSDGLLLLIHLSPRLTLQGFQNVGKCPLGVLSAVLLQCSSSHIRIFCRKYFAQNTDIFRNILSVATGTVNQSSPPSKIDSWSTLENSLKPGSVWCDRLRDWGAVGFAVIMENSCKLSFHVIVRRVFCKRTALILQGIISWELEVKVNNSAKNRE